MMLNNWKEKEINIAGAKKKIPLSNNAKNKINLSYVSDSIWAIFFRKNICTILYINNQTRHIIYFFDFNFGLYQGVFEFFLLLIMSFLWTNAIIYSLCSFPLKTKLNDERKQTE